MPPTAATWPKAQLAAARAALSAAKSEHDALARALDQGGGAAIASLKARAAAMSARLRPRWATTAMPRSAARRRAAGPGRDAAAGDPALPAGTECLADHVERPGRAPAALAPGRGGRRGRRPDARRRPAAGHPRRADAPLGRVCRRGRGRRGGRTPAPRQPAGRAGGQLPALDQTRSQTRLATRDTALAAMERGRDAAEAARQAALAAEREAREAARAGDAAAAAIERTRGAALGARPAARTISSRCSRRRAMRLQRPSRRLPHCPIRPRSKHEVEAARGRRPPAATGGRRQARRGRDPGARNRRRPRAAWHRQRASRPSGASARRTPPSGSPRRSSGRRSWPTSAPSSSRSRPRSTQQSRRSSRPMTRARFGSAKPPPPRPRPSAR